MAEIATAYVSLLASARGFGSSIEQQTSGQIQSSGKRLGSTFGKVFGLAGGALAAVGIGSFLKGSLEEAREAAEVGARTESVIKSMGLTGKVSAGQISDFAGSLSAKVGVDDEAIQSGQNLLLTFGNVAKSAGQTGGVFEQTTKLAVDMSAALGQDMKSSSIQLGKALNDPIKGVSALSRVGVSFTAQQKEQIAGFVETGDVAKAQGVILGEVGKQFGGAAEAMATPGDKAAIAFGNIKEQIGTALIPIVDKLAKAFLDAVPTITRLIDGIGPVFATISRAVQSAMPTIVRLISGLGPIFLQIGSAIRPVISFIASAFASLGGNGSGGAGGLSATITQLMATFRVVFANVQTIIRDAVSIVQSLWARFGGIITNYTRNAFKNAMQIIRGAFDVIAGIFKTVSALLKGDWRGVWEGIKQIVRGAWNVIKGVVRQGWNLVSSIFRAAGSALRGIWGGIWDGIKELAGRAFDAIVSLVRKEIDNLVDLIKGIPGKISAVGGKFLDAGREIMGKIFDGIRAGAGGVGDFISSIASAIKNAINSALGLPFTITGPGPLPDFTIPAFAKGTNYFRGGLALVGEEGPELVNLPKGSAVKTAAETRRLARNPLTGATVRDGVSSGASGFPSTALLRIGDRDFVSYVSAIAESQVSSASDFDAERRRAQWSR